MGISKLSRTQVLLLLKRIDDSDHHLGAHLKKLIEIKRLLPVLLAHGDSQAQSTMVVGSVNGTPVTTNTIVNSMCKYGPKIEQCM
jgi:hypothetical protein